MKYCTLGALYFHDICFNDIALVQTKTLTKIENITVDVLV